MFILFFSLLLILCEGEEDSGKVFGGRLAHKGEFPSVVSVYGKSLCGGVIITLDKVITAAHCMINIATSIPKPINDFTIYGGTMKIPQYPRMTTDKEAQKRKISKFKIHEKFKVKGGVAYHDIALLTLEKAFVHNKILSPAKLPSRNKKGFIDAWKSFVDSKKKCVGVGWGATKYTKVDKKDVPTSSSEDLKVIDLTPVEQKSCIGNRDMNEKGYICVISEVTKGESMCLGDSGSPLYCDGNVFGIVSSVTKCGSKANVTYYVILGLYLDYFGLEEHHRHEGQDQGSIFYSNPLLFIISSLIMADPYY